MSGWEKLSNEDQYYDVILVPKSTNIIIIIILDIFQKIFICDRG
ncbi:hypothetical protein HMPREF0539_0338 [Lacticaseibacillus rhamnosus LMS2-1]|uniref:Uncharacterized protein n=1 Tax=Lacticaseibacillus rhamnosus (strain LMS2-1) TaxID=525361 RepID=C2JTV4_LACRM|nr:hypothetical protein HMPREF0539_0338 [Lacticaseibacillus rhamnosus LMS2-1]